MKLFTCRRRPVRKRSASKRNMHRIMAGLAMSMAATVVVRGGDILRGGATAGKSPGGAPSTGGVNTPPPVVPSGGSSKDSLSRTTQALQSVKAMQAAAKALANSGANNLGQNPNNPGQQLPNVPDGLGQGGLQVDSRVATDGNLWKGANLPVQSTTSNGKTQVTVQQTAQQALLNWETLNVGKNTQLKFDQSAGGSNVGQWIAFNKVNDPSSNPTQILGTIEAPGQVYILNRNGVIFGGSSQVNTRGLTVSSLPINNNLIERGLLNNPEAEFLFNGLDAGASDDIDPNKKFGDIIVQKGATLTSPSSDAKVGGRIMLVGPNVINHGTISTPDGQTILASGLQVGFDAHDTNDPSLRGLDVYIGAVVDPASALAPYVGTSTNTGLIEATRGNITIAGREVNQLGALTATTSVSLNGRIDLLAHYDAMSNIAYNPTDSSAGKPFLYRKSGTVTLGEESLISILPELDSKETTIGTELALRSQINMAGKSIHLGKDSLLYAPNAKVKLSAGEWIMSGSSNAPIATFVQSGGQVYLDENAQIDVSGSIAVPVSVAQNILEIQLRGAELANSPLQREGDLRNATIYVDIRDAGIYQQDMWIGTPLADISGFANLIQRGVGQLTVAGGSVDVSAGGSFVMQKGSEIDVSGGSVQFQGGVVKTTRLLTKDGKLVDIRDARPNEVYKGIYDGTNATYSKKWGIANVFGNPLAPNGERYEAGSIQGGSGGSVSVTAPTMALDGNFIGKTINGLYQRSLPVTPSSLKLSFVSQDPAYSSYPLHAPNAPKITFQSGVVQDAAAAFSVDAQGIPAALSSERAGNVYLSPDLLTAGGIGSFILENPDGTISVPEGVTLIGGPKGAITMVASNIGIDGSIIAHGGSLTFKSPNLTLDQLNQLENSSNRVLPVASQVRGQFLLGEKAVLSTAGLLVDDRLTDSAAGTAPLVLDGGSISISAYTTMLKEGGLIDVSGGASMDSVGKVNYGDAGSISIAAGRDINLSAVLGGKLELGATLHGYSGAGAKAGSLAITAPAIQVGGSTQNTAVTLFQSDFFNTGGFGSFALAGIGLPGADAGSYVPGLLIAGGTVITPKAESHIASAASDGELTLSRILLEEGARTPVSLTFSALGAADPYASRILVRGDVVMGENAVIRTDAQASVNFQGETVTLNGSVYAAGGSINVNGANRFPTDSVNMTGAQITTHIGSSAVLSTAGKTVLLENALGLRQGKVLAGGTITLSGNVVAEQGAVLDVSGTSGVLDLAPGYLSLDPTTLKSVKGRDFVPVTLETNGGSINLNGAQMLYSDATLLAHAGGASAVGGSLSVSSARFIRPGDVYTSADTNLVVRQSGPTLPMGNESMQVGMHVTDAHGTVVQGMGNFSVDTYANGGFDSLALNGNVKFEGDVTIHAPGRLRVASGGVLTTTGNVELNATSVTLGQAFRPPALPTDQVILFTRTDDNGTTPYNFAPTYGQGRLTVNADHIDIGTLSLQETGTARFFATKGDIRGNGTLSASGNLFFQAGQIYPTTQSVFNIFSYDFNAGNGVQHGTVTIEGGEKRSLPLSAGGTLSIYASEITQSGTLRAPIGTINLGWDGTGTAPIDPIAPTGLAKPIASKVTLRSDSVTSVSAIDPKTGKGVVIPYGISLDGETWIDPAGNDITVGGAPAKKINLSAAGLISEQGSVVDIQGGGDLYAYRWIQGNGGRKDVLAVPGSFAVMPGYDFDYAPYGAFNDSASAAALGKQPGYVDSSLKIGDKVTLAASSGLPAGTYTLLPARYALLPGAFLVTPKNGVPVGNVARPDGATIVSGYRSNNLDPNRTGATAIGNFEVASSKVIRARSEYQDLYANTTLRNAALAAEFSVPRLPLDSGYLSLSASSEIVLNGLVRSTAPKDGRGGLVDINSPVDILINGAGTGGVAGTLVLSADLLNSFGAESLLIGGLRSFGPEGTAVSVSTGNLTVDNAGHALIGSDILLVAKNNLTLEEGATITATGSQIVDSVTIGDADAAGSGNGALVRVSGSKNAFVTRAGVGNSLVPKLEVSAGVFLTGGSLTLDSTNATLLDPAAQLRAETVALSSGRLSILLNQPGAIDPTNSGLVLSGQALQSLQSSAHSLSLRSYSTLDVYGTGSIGSRAFEQLALEAGAIRGFNQAGGSATFSAANLQIENTANVSVASTNGSLGGSLIFDADQITLGANAVRVDDFASVRMIGDKGIVVSGKGSFLTKGSLDLVTPLVTGAKAADHTIASEGGLRVLREGGATARSSGGLGAKLTLEGAHVEVNSNITLASGNLSLHAKSGDLRVGNSAAVTLDVGGTSKAFHDVMRYTDAGTIKLASDSGNVRVGQLASLNLSATSGGGDAGTLEVETPGGTFDLQGMIRANVGANGEKGAFRLDAGVLSGGSLATMDATLNQGGFTLSRDYRIRTGDVMIEGDIVSQIYRVAADSGDIVVRGDIDASGETGGSIDLKANGSLILENGARLSVAAEQFNAAGKGGSIVLEAGTQRNGLIDPTAMLDLRSGSTLDLSVAAEQAGSQSLGQFTGTLHLRAPRTAANNDVQIAAIGSSITGASSIMVEGNKLYDLTGSGVISTTVQNNIRNDATAFLGSAGSVSANYNAMYQRLTSLSSGLDLILTPGAEIINRTGDLTLGTTSSTASSDWNLATFRFGPKSSAGILTLRAAKDITFYNALSDGFSGGASLWLSPLMANNGLLPANSQSWSYRITAGSDLAAASFRDTVDGIGNFKLGKNVGAATASGGTNATTASVISNAYQVVRTGSGNIDIHAGNNVQLLNPFAAIYTAGTQVANPTSLEVANDFVVPILNRTPAQGVLGAHQQTYGASYSMAGGNVVISAGNNIERKTADNGGLIDDSSRQLPNNWLYRRGFLGADGNYGVVRITTGIGGVSDPAASTTWWVDFSNFFQSVGALGGGNVSLVAGQDVKNVDAVIPTNARAPKGAPDSTKLVELGGGDLSVIAGRDINGGVYYVERGSAKLDAGANVTTNATRAPALGIVGSLNNPAQTSPLTWMPTTLFLGKATFDVTANGDVTLGPIANPFLLPQGNNNKFWYKSYFNTYAPDSGVAATSLGGTVNFRSSVVLADNLIDQPFLRAWMERQQLLPTGATGAAFYQPWLRLAESSLDPFAAAYTLAAPNLSLTSFSGDVNLGGDTTLFPSSKGQLEIVSSGSIHAMQALGRSNLLVPGRNVQVWNSATFNVSDADPNAVPTWFKPLSGATVSATTQQTIFNGIASLFGESGSYTGSFGVTQTKQALHAAGILHRDDLEPVRIYAEEGDVTGLTLFSPKATRVLASRDISDVSLYLQNVRDSDVSLVSAGRDLVAYNANTAARLAAITGDNAVAFGAGPQAGDIQISGPGAIEVFAGRDFDLGIGVGNPDGTGSGLTSIGNLRNPYLSTSGADIILGAGIGGATGLATSELHFDRFITEFVKVTEGEKYLKEVAPGVVFDDLGEEEQARVTLEIFYRILRDTGRDFNNVESDGYRKYDRGMAAIKSLFGDTVGQWKGDIFARGRDIRTRSGGDISIFAPGGSMSLANTVIGNPLAPPGVVTESGGNISLFTEQSVDIGIGRIFTLRGGNAIIWSTKGDIAAGSSSRTIQAAPPTRVIVDPQSASVATDLAGLATGGGIGVLATVQGVKPGDVDLIAPSGTIDAGDAGIRVSGNINLAAVSVVNAGNISAGGTSTGAPSAPSVTVPSVSVSNAATSATNSAGETQTQQTQQATGDTVASELPSLITVEVLGYGGGEGEEEEDESVTQVANP